MIKISYFNYKFTALLSILALTSGLTFVASTNHTLPGFHITVKENNDNDIKLVNTWNTINDKYEQLLKYNKDKLINVEFNQWSQITNQLQTPISDDVISKEVANAFQGQIDDKNNNFMPTDGKQYFDKAIIGRSFANKNFDSGISSFGSVYYNYSDQLSSSINNGLFATINPESSFTDYFSVPYTLQASKDILQQSLSERLKIIPIGDNNIKSENENELVILAKATTEEKLVIKCGNTNIDPISNDNLSYAIIAHNPTDGFNATNFSVDASSSSTNEVVHHDITISNKTSQLSFTTGTKNDITNIDSQYLVKNVAGNDNLIVMNYAKGNATVKIPTNEKWTYANVDTKTLTINSTTTKSISNGEVLTASSSPTGIQVYYLALDTQDKAQQQASGQYVTIYNQNQVPTFSNCTNLFADGNVTLQGFQQYLNSTDNLEVNDLKGNASALVSQFITYQGAIAKHNYINYLTTNNDDPNPFHINVKPTSKTLVNNWNIIILACIFFSLLIILPFVILLIRKRKRLK
ncbi:hypothetical protein [Spiroplasma endosymbiont of Virgichneumon dumeticola]|uniref:hypothetical protein n=1 Tax=Spiroplasma endosymbiont of Virgichneumon dumeticola TaxID=3139323 RepID=UPI0035C88202